MGHLVLLLTSTVGCFVVAFELSGRYSGGRRELGRSIDFCTSGVCLEVESLGARRTILQHNDCRMSIELCQSLSKPFATRQAVVQSNWGVGGGVYSCDT
jgi:hypothetical protein